MTIYAGEYVKIGVSIKGEKTPGHFVTLTPADLTSGALSIWAENGRVVVAEQELVYDAETEMWFFYWDTAGSQPGLYEYRAVFYGEGNRRTWEEGTIRLHPSKRPVMVVSD